MALTATLTGTTGPGVTVTAGVYQNVTEFNINSVNNVVSMRFSDGRAPAFVSVNAAATVTATKSGFTWTVTIS